MEADNSKFKKLASHSRDFIGSHINNLDDGCLMLVFSFLLPIPAEFVNPIFDWHYLGVLWGSVYGWRFLACDLRLWLRVDQSIKDVSEPGVFPNIVSAIHAARPGDTILIAAGGFHHTCNIQINKPLCLIGAGEFPDDTTLICSHGSDSALEFLSTCKLANLTMWTKLGCCLLHRSGRLKIDGCFLQCESDPLDHLSDAILTTATTTDGIPPVQNNTRDRVSVLQTRIEGGAKAVLTNGSLSLQQVRVIYARTSLFFWFNVDHS